MFGNQEKIRGFGACESSKRPPRKTIRGANSAPRKAAATKARGRGKPRPYKSMLGHLKVAAMLGAELIGCGGAGGYWSCFADGVAVDDEFDASIALAAFGGVVGGYGLRFAEAAGGH